MRGHAHPHEEVSTVARNIDTSSRSSAQTLHPDFRPGNDPGRALGLTSTTAIVVGSIIGTGVFTMPAVMAGAGTSSILTLVAISIGAGPARRALRAN
jgi:cytosine/uracil/thiamine/allantoin permease